MAKSNREKELEQEIYNMNLTFKQQLEEKEILLTNKNELIKELRDKINNYEKEFLYNKTDKEVVKKILSLYAKGNTFKTIREKLQYNRMECDLEFIKSICLNVNDLDSDMLLYYKEQVEAFEKSIKINPDILKENMIQRLDLLINDATMDLDRLEDLGEKTKLRATIKDMIKEQNAVLKNIVDDKILNKDKSMEILETKMEEYNNNLNEMMKFNFSIKDILTTDTIN